MDETRAWRHHVDYFMYYYTTEVEWSFHNSAADVAVILSKIWTQLRFETMLASVLLSQSIDSINSMQGTVRQENIITHIMAGVLCQSEVDRNMAGLEVQVK